MSLTPLGEELWGSRTKDNRSLQPEQVVPQGQTSAELFLGRILYSSHHPSWMLFSIYPLLSKASLAHLIQEAVRVTIAPLSPAFCLG